MSFDYGETAYMAVLNDLKNLEKEIVRLRQALARIKNASNPNEEPVSRAIAADALEDKE